MSFRYVVPVLVFMGTMIGDFRVQAGPLTYEFSGVVTEGIFDFNPKLPLIGSKVTGTISYDPSTTPNSGSTATEATYTTGAITFFVASVNFLFQSESPTNAVTTVVTMPGIRDSFSISTPGTGYIASATFTLNDSTGTAFSSSTLPTALSLADFQPGSGNSLLYTSHHDVSDFSVSIDRLQAAVPVPEPSSLILGLLTLPCFVVWVMRRGVSL